MFAEMLYNFIDWLTYICSIISDRMEALFQCKSHPWLKKVFDIRENWCCAYGKNHFSAGVLSSQRSESANHSISRRVSKTTSLCDFYNIFGTVVSEWRSTERKDNALCWDGVPEVSIPCNLLENAAKVYTINAFKRFEKEFMKSMSYKHKLETTLDQTHCYFVSPTRTEEFGHYVTYESTDHYAYCSCKRFEESGFLCRHILRIYHLFSVDEIPPIYILKRWTKYAKAKDDITEEIRGKVVGPVFRLDMHRKFHKLIIASVDNEMARSVLNDCFIKARFEIEGILGGIDFSDTENNTVDIIQNPIGKNQKGERFTRKRSLIDIATKRASGKIKAAETRARKRAATKSTIDDAIAPETSQASVTCLRKRAANTSAPRHMGLRQILMS